MPTYDYECTKCGHSFDEFQNMSDDPLSTCPECGKNTLRRLIGGGLGIIFKGSGFYSTDSRSGGKSSGGADSKKPEPVGSGNKSDSGSTSKSDSKSSSTKPKSESKSK